MDNENLDKYINYIKDCLIELYDNENELFENNLCERCLTFRFAHFLQNKFHDENVFVDCDYNSSTYFNKETGKWERRNGKPIVDQDKAKITKRFIDIIVHKRGSYSSDLICFELKKWNSSNSKDKNGIYPMEKDKNNLKVLTSVYGYEYGFHLIFGERKEDIKMEIFKDGRGDGLNLLFNN